MTSPVSSETRCARGHVLMLAPSPDISGPHPGPIAKVAYRLVDALRTVGYVVDTELWGRHQRHEGIVAKVFGRAVDLVRIRRRMSKGPYDLVFIHTTHDWPALLRDLLLVLPSPARTRWVVLIHGSHFRPGRRLFDAAARRLVGRAKAVLLLSSDEVAEWGRFYPAGHYYLVANALAPAARDGSKAAAPVPRSGRPEILFVGRLTRRKGLYELLDAFSSVRSHRPCRLTVAGEGPESEALQLRAERLGVADDVEFTGHLLEDDVARLYRRSDVFVLPSYSEGLPTVLLEALSFGLPIITTPIRGAADHLVEGENALFVPPRESGTLADAIGRLLDDGELRARMAENNLRKAEDFAPDKVVRAYVRAFDDVVAREDGS